MNRTTKISLLAVGMAFAVLLTAVLAFMLGNMVSTGSMKRIEVNGRVISMEGARMNYRFDVPLYKSEPVDGVLVMQDGTEYDISFSDDFDVFTINNKLGYYTLDI